MKLLVVLLFSCTGLAQWNVKEREHQKAYSHAFSDPYAASLWRAANTPWYMARDFSNYQKETLRVKGPGSDRFYVRIGSFLHRDSSGHVLKKPLMIFLPGMFSNLKNPIALQHGHFFYQKGYHVLLLSNPWSKNWIVDLPIAPMGDLESETAAVEKLIREFESLYPDKISSTSLYGYSYGAFLGASVVATGQRTYEDVLLVGPPLDVRNSMERLDRLADQTYEKTQHVFSLLWEVFIYVNKKTQSELSLDTIEKAPATAIFAGFIEELAAGILTYGYKRGLNFEPPGLYGQARRSWQRSFRFRDYIRDFLPNFIELTGGDKALFAYWAEAAAAKTRRLRLLTTVDDFLNTPEQTKFTARGERWMLLPQGGHVGFMGQDWYWELLNIGFGQPIKYEFPKINSDEAHNLQKRQMQFD